MYRIRGFFAVAMLCSAVLWSMSATPVNAATLPDLSAQFQITTTVPDVTTTIPTVPTTWGGIKALFGSDKSDGPSGAPRLIPGSHDWSNNTLSEAFYEISPDRSGDSGNYYQGWTMSQKGWDYPHSDLQALADITRYFNSPTGGLGLWNGFQQGGECIFNANQILYRCSFGYGGGYHLVIPKGTYTYATQSTRVAGIGWVLQSASMPHTAIVVAVYSNGLDVVDSNWVGGRGNYAISRHLMTWSTLDGNGFKAYCPWTDGYKYNNWGLWHP